MAGAKQISTFRAFRNRNYALFFTGQTISQVGTWMQGTGISWVIYTMTHSTFMLGLAVFATLFPRFLFSLAGGIVADRYNRYTILLITQSASMVQAVLLTVVTLATNYAVWELLTLSVLLGVINAFDSPARQPMVHLMINDKEDLPNALALNSSMVNFARIVGPALAGIILEKLGVGICFLVNALSFVAVITSLLLMKLPKEELPVVSKGILSGLTSGFAYLKRTPSISMILLMVSLMNFLVMPYDTLLPVFAKVVFRGDATTFGYIRSFIGVGAIAGAFFLASLKPNVNLRTVLLINTAVFGIGLMSFSHLGYFPLAMVFAVLVGFGAMSQTTICLTITQMDAIPEMRGRVMSYLIMAMAGMMPLGSLLIGGLSQHIGARNTLFIQGIIALAIAAVFIRILKRNQAGISSVDNAGETTH
ncbi:MFS transporter [Microbacter margulisiae]|uniref:MFS family permease n=1 Tax=Microbacter margulisiae TaxID=1350067 RepID=A0A7W5DR18_9PORP|nr:MFS transporter [Microbacter margulisiae]MBB3187522.1 MFS family permease [Microbacter margulisiae]